MNRLILFLFLGVFGFVSLCQAGDNNLANWHQWRGPNADGMAVKGDPPIHWDEKTNIKWKVALPGKGSSTPIVWGDRVFVTTTIDTGRKADPKDIPKVDPNFVTKTEAPKAYHQFMVMCLDRLNGKQLWKKVAAELVPHEGHHPTHSYAAASPMTDGKYLYVSFGSYGIFCFDLQGNQQWKADLGDMHTRYGWGEATSPVVYGDSLIINWDHEGQSELFRLNARTGKIHWQVKRDEPTSWATPIVVKHKGKTQVIVHGTNFVRSYDLANGKLIWQCGGQTLNAIPSPIVRDDVVYVMSGYRGAAAHAFPLNARGDITGTNKILWQLSENTPYVPSPLLMGNRLYFTSKNFPFLTCVDVTTGKVKYEKRLPLGGLYASPTGVGDRFYIVDRNGTTVVLQHGDEGKILATNRLDANIDASPVIVEDQLFLRGHNQLYCIQESGE